MTRKFLLLPVLLFLSTLSFSQSSNELINSGELINKGIRLYEQDKYKEALDLYNKVSPSDTNYVWALYTKALACRSDSQFVQALDYCKEALVLKKDREREPQLYAEYGNLLDLTKNREHALQLFDSAISVYPAYINLYINKAAVLIRAEKYREAEKVLQQGVMISPYSSDSHFKLALSAIKLGKLVPAYLGFTTCLIMNPEGDQAKSAISILNSMANNLDEITGLMNKRTEEPGDNFKMIEQIVTSKIALDKNYKILIKLDDAISRQLQVILEKLEYDADEKDFYMQYYVPFYKKMFAEGRLEALVNYAFSGVNIASIKAYNKNNKKEIEAFTSNAANYFSLIRSTRQIDPLLRKMDAGSFYYSNNVLYGKGESPDNGKTLTGPWTFYYGTGNVKSKGGFTASGTKDGKWQYYYYNGQLSAEEFFRNGKQDDKETYYYDNGVLSAEGGYLDGQLTGEYKNYYNSGALKESSQYKNGKLNGPHRIYYKSGVVQEEDAYADDKRDGLLKAYYISGKPDREVSYVKGIASGPFRGWYENGQLKTEGQYVNDEMSGSWKRYHSNGKLKSTENYVNGQLEGEYIEYYNNGQLYTRYNSRKGKMEGDATYYDEDGKMYCVLLFEKDKLKAGKYFDKSGKQISASESNGKKLALTTYTPEGFRKAQRLYNEDGNAEGTHSFYYTSGTLRETNTYANGDLEGIAIHYHVNKQKKNEVNYTGDNKDGYLTSWYSHGGKEQEGWYKDNKAQGNWIDYDELGAVIAVTPFLNDDIHGIQSDYWPNGKLRSQSYHQFGVYKGIKQYDTTGQLINNVLLTNGSGDHETRYVNGRLLGKGKYVNDNRQGNFTYYFFDGSPETEEYYKHGLRDSSYRDYYYGGKLRIEGQYKLGDKAGVWKYYRSDGYVSSVEEYRDGELNGLKIYYHRNGKKDYEIPYVDGERNGIAKRYSEDGELMYLVEFKHDEAAAYSYPDKTGQPVPYIPVAGGNGNIETFYANGKRSALFGYVDGKLHGQDNIYYSSGKPAMESEEVYGSSEGKVTNYYPDGTIKSIYNYLHDNLHGTYQELNTNGKVSNEGSYYNGYLHGPIKYYDDNGKLKETRNYYYGQLLEVKK